MSPYGVLDTAGNVQEWVAGEYRLYTGPPPSLNPGEGVVRGGSFATPAQHLSTASRAPISLSPGTPQWSSVGFRCAVDARAGLALSADRETASSQMLQGGLWQLARRD